MFTNQSGLRNKVKADETIEEIFDSDSVCVSVYGLVCLQVSFGIFCVVLLGLGVLVSLCVCVIVLQCVHLLMCS